MKKSKKRFLGFIFISFFLGSLVLGIIFENLKIKNEAKIQLDGGDNYFDENGPIEPPIIITQSDFTLEGQNQTDSLLYYQGAALYQSNSTEDLEIDTNGWNASDILLNFTDIHEEEGPIIVEEQTPPGGYLPIFNTSGFAQVGIYAMQFNVPDDCFIFRFKVFLNYQGNFSVFARILPATLGVSPPAPSSSEYVAVSQTVDFTTYGTENVSEWVEFFFTPRDLKALLDSDSTEGNTFFIVLEPIEMSDVGGGGSSGDDGASFLQWGYQLDANGDDGFCYVYNGNTWSIIIIGMGGTVDLLLTDIMYSTFTYDTEIDIESSSHDYVLVYDEERGIGNIYTQNNSQQFQPSSTGYLRELDVYVQYRGSVIITADIYNASESVLVNPGEALPDSLLFSSVDYSVTSLGASSEWISLRFPSTTNDRSSLLDLQNTFNHSFFVVLRAVGTGFLLRESVLWSYEEDSNNGNEGHAYYWNESRPPEQWTLFLNHTDVGENIDLNVRNINIVTYELNPSDMNLQINGTQVEDYSSFYYGGSLLFNGTYNDSGGSLLLDIVSDYNVYYYVIWSALFTNQTEANTYYLGKSLSDTINWNVTLYSNFPKWNSSTEIIGLYGGWGINITFPKGNLISTVKYLSVSLPENIFWFTDQSGITQRLVLRNFSIFFPPHGTAGPWLIQATSTNFIEEIRTYNGTDWVNQFYVGDEMNVTAKLLSQTSVEANLSIYDRDNQIVNTSLKGTPGLWVDFPIWTVNKNGTHHTVVYWHNGTHVGIRSLSLECVYHTNLSVVYTNIGVLPFDPTENIYIDVFYNDTDNNVGLTGANIKANVSFLVSEDTTAGVYNLTLQPFLLINGNYTAKIEATKSGYNLSVVYVKFAVYSSVNASLDAVGGVVFTSGKWWVNPDPYFDDQTPLITVLYANGTFPYEGIEYAQIVVSPNWTSTTWFGNPTNLTPGFYDVQIDTMGLHEGDIGEVLIIAYSGAFETKVIQIYVNVTEIPSSLLYIDAGQYSNITAYEGETIDIAVGYWDDFHGNPIVFENSTAGNITWSIIGTGANSTLEKSVWQYEDSISLPSWGINGTQTYQITIVATAALDYATTETNLTLNVLSKENTTLTLSNWTATEYRVGNSFSVFADLSYENGTALINKRVDLNITLKDKTGGVIDSYLDSRNTNSTGIAKYEFPTINPGIYNITINASYEGTEQIDPASDLLVVPIKPKYNVTLEFLSELPSEIMVGSALELQAQLLNNETLQGIANATVEFILFNGQNILEERKVTTDGNGMALVEIEITDAMADYVTFEIRVVFPGSATSNSAEYTAVTSVSVMTVGKLILRYVPYVAVAAVAIVGTYLSYRQFVAVPRRRRRFARMEKLATKFVDIVNLQHILVLHSDAGTCIFQHSFGEVTFDPDLISGFLTAISAFQTELTAPAATKVPFGEKVPSEKVPSEKETRGFELSYANFKILLQDAAKTRTALILSADPTESIRSALDEFVVKFETKYEKDLRNWRGAMAPFQNANELVEATFETSLLWPHRIETLDSETVKGLNSLESSLFTLALETQTNKRYFFLPALVGKAGTIRRESQIEILGTIDDLRQKGIFKAIPIERLEEQLKTEANNQKPEPAA